MSKMIQLEHRVCPKCSLAVDRWTVKSEVVDGTLGIRCPSCREIIKLVVSTDVEAIVPEQPITPKEEAA